MNSLYNALKASLQGDVRFDSLSKKIYSVDASIYEIEPVGIVIPKDINELQLAMRLAADHGVPVIPRGAATGITGSCLGRGLIIDASKYLNQILAINIEEEYAICEPGVVQDRLNECLSSYGYRLGPDTSTGNRATIGGMLANNSAGARSLYYGQMADHVLQVDLALAGGQIIRCSPIDDAKWKLKRMLNDEEGRIYRELFSLSHNYHQVILDHFPKIPRRVSGYNLNTLLVSPLNIGRLIAGSEGTLGIATKIKVGIVKNPKHTAICVLHAADMILGMQSIEAMLEHRPLALEMIDKKIIEMGRLSPTVRNKLSWLKGNPEAVFVAEFEADSPEMLNAKLQAFILTMSSQNISYANQILHDPQKIREVWDVRKAGLGLLLSKRSYQRAIAFIEDLSIPPHRLASFIAQFRNYLKGIGKEAGIYGHIGSGCIHIRPYIDLRKEEELFLMKRIMEDISDMVMAYGGAMSGEHGDGLIRSWLNEKVFGKELYQAFCSLKAAFDPNNLVNPGKIVHGPPLLKDLRLSPQTHQVSISTFQDFSNEGGFELAADLCNGNAECRKKEGVMCPSFQVSNDEYDTTRARAQALRAVIHGKLPTKTLTDDSLYDVLDLCIECKGCKKECPSQVDMAKMKAEVLYQFQEMHGYFLRNRLFAHIHKLNRLLSPFAKSFNFLSKTRLVKSLLNIVGISSQRELPQLAHERFSTWFKKQPQKPSEQRLLLFNDTYTEFNQPEIGQAAFKILTKLGYHITLINSGCCGRPMISKGLLKEAKHAAESIVNVLGSFARQNIPIICLEPSCLSALKDDYKGLLGNSHVHLQLVKPCLFSLDEFLHRLLDNGFLSLPFSNQTRRILLHSHCHQKALSNSTLTLELLRSIKGFEVEEINSGCCGVAGAFGYEKEHYEFSIKIGNLRLLPAVLAASPATVIVASGMSCRSQIQHATGRRALHLAEIIANQMATY